MKFTKNLAAIVFGASSLFSCVYQPEEKQIITEEPEDYKHNEPEKSPQVKFAEWFVENKVKYYGSPAWCPPCQLFEYELTPEGFEVLANGGSFIECSKSYEGPVAQECIDEKIYALPTFKASWLNEPLEGYNGLEVLAIDLGYPDADEL